MKLVIRLASTSKENFWDRLTDEEQDAYLAAHPRSKKVKTAKPEPAVDGQEPDADFGDEKPADGEEPADEEAAAFERAMEPPALDPESQAIHDAAFQHVTRHEREVKRRDGLGPTLPHETPAVHAVAPAAHPVPAVPAPSVPAPAVPAKAKSAERKALDHLKTPEGRAELKRYEQGLEDEDDGELAQSFLSFYGGQAKMSAKFLKHASRYIAEPVANVAGKVFGFDGGQVYEEDPEFEAFKKDPDTRQFMALLGTVVLTGAALALCPSMAALAIPLSQMALDHYIENLGRQVDPDNPYDPSGVKRKTRQREIERAQFLREIRRHHQGQPSTPSTSKKTLPPPAKHLPPGHPGADDYEAPKASLSNFENESPTRTSETEYRLLRDAIHSYRVWLLSQGLSVLLQRLETKNASAVHFDQQKGDARSVQDVQPHP